MSCILVFVRRGFIAIAVRLCVYAYESVVLRRDLIEPPEDMFASSDKPTLCPMKRVVQMLVRGSTPILEAMP